jgi:hypothetical protein
VSRIYLRCDVCRDVSHVDVPDDVGVHVVEPCAVCGSEEIALADYTPPEDGL